MQVVSQLKTNPAETILVLSVADEVLIPLMDQLEQLKVAWMNGDGLFHDAQGPGTEANSLGSYGTMSEEYVVNLFKQAASYGLSMSAPQKRNIEETLGPSRAASIFGPTWGENGAKMWRLAAPQVWERVNGTWVQKPNEFYRDDLFQALLSVPGEDPNTFGQQQADIPKQQTPQSWSQPPKQETTTEPENPADWLESIRHKSYEGFKMTDNAISAAEKMVPGITKWMPGGKNGGLDLFYKYAGRRMRDPANREKWIDNPDFNYQWQQYALKTCAR